MELRRSVLRLVIGASLVGTLVPVGGQTSSQGQWSAVFEMPLVTVHAALMRTGQLLFFDAWEIPGTPSARLWEPTTGAYTAVPNGFAELFCAGHFLTSDGRLLTAGGHNGSGVGTTDATVFDPATLQWTALADLTYARWYPSVIQLPDGRALTMGGAISRPDIAEVPEALTLGAAAWTTFPGGQKDVGEYPMLFQGPDGRVFVNGFDASFQSWLYNVSTASWTALGVGPAMAGTAVMYRPGKVMMTGGGAMGVDPVTGATGVLDLTVPTPAWRATAPMAFGRSQHNLVLLPDGRVLVVGGAAEVSLVSTQPVLPAEIWDPDTETWTQVAPMTRPRMYHSIAILLPDGRVLAAGGGRLGPNEQNGQIYSPPYLFRGARPTITAAPATVAYGAAFTVSTPQAGSIARVTLVRTSSVTHGMNLDQRFVELPVTVTGSGTVSVVAPSDPRTAPAGDYLLFVLTGDDVPSVGRFVRLGGAAAPPTISIADASAAEGTAAAGQLVFTVTLSGAAAQTVTVNYSTSDETAQAGSDYASRSGTLSFPPGTVTRTITVPTIADALPEPNETFTVTLTNPTHASLADGTAVGTIVNDDLPTVPTVSVAPVSVVEGSGGGTPVAAFTVTLSSAPAANGVVSYRTVPGTATAPADYTSTTGTLTFAGGTTVQTIQVPIVPDTVDEPDETFTVELFDPVNLALGTATATATILDDDGAGGPVTATFVVATGGDDVTEDGATFAADGTLWAGNGASATASYLGLRFTGVTIPAGATITAARLELTATTTQWTAVAFDIGAEAAPSSAAFSAAAPPSARVLVAPRVSHVSDTQWVAGTRYALDDIRTVVQAVVSRPGWASGHALSVIARGAGAAWARKFVASADGGAADAPRLIVSFVPPTPDPGNQPPVIISATATPASGPAPLTTAFSVAATDPEERPLSYTWTFGDGAVGTGASVTHVYAAPGTYAAHVSVSDGALTTRSSAIAIAVGAASTLVPPGPPKHLVATTAVGSVTFTWQPPVTGGPVESYVMFAGTGPGFTTPIAALPLPPAPSTLTLSGAPPGHYYVRLVALNAAGASLPANEVAVDTTRSLRPGAPVLHPPSVQGHTVTLTWSASAGGTPLGYMLYASVVPDGVPVVAVPVSGTVFSTAGVPSGTFYVRVTAVNAQGASAPSNLVTLVVP